MTLQSLKKIVEEANVRNDVSWAESIIILLLADLCAGGKLKTKFVDE